MKASHQRIPAQSGFTLVEIAIVLVIIGLLLGGILKGQEMITQAKIKNMINDFNGITAAVNSYQDRYRALPGDDIGAATRWTGGVTVSGNGNGVWESAAAAGAKYKVPPGGAPVATEEGNLFWQHLRLAGFVPGATAYPSGGLQPANAVNGIIGVQTSGMGFTSNIICTSNLPDKIAIAVDTQMDDGVSISGQVRGMKNTAPNPDLVTPVAGTDDYKEDGITQYTLCKNL